MVGKLQLEGIGMTSRRTRDRLVNRLMERGIGDIRVLETISNTPRHLFVDEALAHRAYEDTALPIGYKQTISQPYIVARMTEVVLSKTGSLEKVLEIGTGSGYQTTILAQLVPHVYSVERISALQNKARQKLRQLRLYNVQLRHTDGNWGWPEQGPFDAILSTAAPESIPESLLEQLAPDGILVLPVGGRAQELQVVTRKEDSDKFERKTLEPVCFVPLVPGVLS